MEPTAAGRRRLPRSLVLGLVAAALLAIGGVVALAGGRPQGWASIALAVLTVGIVAVSRRRDPSRTR